jgi:hypothetical protein
MIRNLVTVGVLIAVLVAVFAIVPLLGDQIDNSVKYTDGSTWDPANNENITSGQEIWATSSGLISLVVVIGLLALVIGTLLVMGRSE